VYSDLRADLRLIQLDHRSSLMWYFCNLRLGAVTITHSVCLSACHFVFV